MMGALFFQKNEDRSMIIAAGEAGIKITHGAGVKASRRIAG